MPTLRVDFPGCLSLTPREGGLASTVQGSRGGKRRGVAQGSRVRETKMIDKSPKSKLKRRKQRPTPSPEGRGCEWALDGAGQRASRNRQE